MTMEVIQKVVANGSASTLVLSSIPNTYTDLYVLFSLRQATGQNAIARVTFNGTSANLSSRTLAGTGSGVSSFSLSSVDPVVTQSIDTANTFGNGSLYIPNYSGSTAKSFSIDAVSENNATQAFQRIIAGLWNDTSAINSITFTSPDGNWASGSSATLYGIKRFNTTLSPKATGGAISYDSVNNKWVHAFYTSGTFTPTENLTGVEYLVIAGGGGGGAVFASGGGGAGGYRSSVVGESSGGGASAESTLSLTASTNYTVTIGAGGAATTTTQAGFPGSNSVFGSITATGGGGGASDLNGSDAGSGGSGGGGDGGQNASPAGSGTANQGYAGGTGVFNSGGNFGGGAGGGGAGALGGNGTASTTAIGGNGGAGVSSSITGTAVVRAGGGGGGVFTTGEGFTRSTGGNGGGGAGGDGNGAGGNSPVAGSANTGGGGGGGGYGQNGAAGGSGLVIVRYSA